MINSFPKTIQERGSLYANAMHEIRMRLRMIEQLQRTTMPQLFVYESCQLQLRLCCECLAVACLAAQGDFETHKAFREKYEPPVIFKALETIYPDFFPKPSTLTLTHSTAGWHFDGGAVRPLAIVRSEVERLWNLSGSHLHRASAKRYIARTNKVDFKQIKKATEAFWWLIVDHAIFLAPAIANVTATILHVLMDRKSDLMRLHFLHVDHVAGTIAVEDFTILTAEAAADTGET